MRLKKQVCEINGRLLGEGMAPYLVAELSGNHGQLLSQAKALIKAAKKAGAHAVKLQTYTPDTLTLNARNHYFKLNNGGLWHGQYLYDLYQKAHTPWKWHGELADYARKLGITLFSTPFDETAVDFLEAEVNPPLYKISSFDVIHIPLLRRVGRTQKPVLLSTGMASIGEIQEALFTLKKAGAPMVVLLKCISNYPAEPENFHLRSLEKLRKHFRCPVGLSDHSLGLEMAIGSIALGTCVIEKHLALRRDDLEAVDAGFSITPQEFDEMAYRADRLYRGLGNKRIGRSKQEGKELQCRRSIFIAADIAKGELLTEKNLRIVKPSYGLAPRYWDIVLGKKAKKHLRFGSPLRRGDWIEHES